MNDIERLAERIRELYGCAATHVRTDAIPEQYKGQHVTVEVFALHGHKRAGVAYAWSYRDDLDNPQHSAVLGIGTINSAASAVRATVRADPNECVAPPSASAPARPRRA